MGNLLRNLYLMTAEEGGESGGGSDDSSNSGEQGQQNGDQGKGFPAETPIAEMTVDQQAAYWKHQARKHESRARSAIPADEYQKLKDELEQIKQSQLTDQEKDLEQAKAEARAAGETTAAERYQRDLVVAKLQIATRQDEAALKYLDHKAFLTDSGEVDADKVTEYAELNKSQKPQEDSWSQDAGKRGSHDGGKPSLQAGRDLFEARHGRK